MFAVIFLDVGKVHGQDAHMPWYRAACKRKGSPQHWREPFLCYMGQNLYSTPNINVRPGIA